MIVLRWLLGALFFTWVTAAILFGLWLGIWAIGSIWKRIEKL